MKRTGFTLVELLVVIAIVGILVGLLFPAVQMVRESARRTHCRNNLKQIGLALQNYHEAHQHYPAGWTSDTDAGVPGWGWLPWALPFLEQRPVYDQINFRDSIERPEHDSVRLGSLPFILCPSAPSSSETVFDLPAGLYPDPYAASSPIAFPFQISRAHYVGCVGTTVASEEMDNGEFCPSLVYISQGGTTLDGIFYRNSRVRLEHVYDGTSHTISVGERSGKIFDSTWVGVVHGASYPVWRILGWTGEPPNNRPTSPVHFHGFAQFNSAHSMLTHFALLDGSVQTYPDSIDAEVFKSMGTVRGTEIPKFDY